MPVAMNTKHGLASGCSTTPRHTGVVCRAVQSVNPPTLTLPSPQLLSIGDTAKEIRSRLCSEQLAGGLVFSAGGGLVKRNGLDVHYRFRPQSNFVWLTGCEEPDAATLIDTQTGHTTLLLCKQEADAAFWSGPQPTPDEVAERYGVDRVAYTCDLPSLLHQHQGQDVHVTSDQDMQVLRTLMGLTTQQHNSSSDSSGSSSDGGSSGSSSGSGSSGSTASGARLLDAVLPPVVKRLRSLKTASEVACLLEANRISGAAHVDTWRACRPGMLEYQLEAVFTASCMTQGLTALGYPCIVGAGANAAVLHYDSNRCKVGAQDLVLIDAGAEFRCYTADITRTFPANGRFTPQQRDIYQAVLDSQMLSLSLLAPGVVLKDVEDQARKLMISRLQDLGLLSRTASVDALMSAGADRVFMPHGLGHHLGLDVHDISDTGPTPKGKLQVGHVITVEPGLYFIKTLLARAAANPELAPLLCWDVVERYQHVGGVRIEDNVAIMESPSSSSSSSQVLNITMAAGVPKTVAAIEEAMAQGGR